MTGRIAAESVVEEKRTELEGAIGDKRAEVEAAYEADVRRHDERFTARLEELATAAAGRGFHQGGRQDRRRGCRLSPTGEVIVRAGETSRRA